MIMNVFFYCCGNHLQYNHNNSVIQMVIDIVMVVAVLQIIAIHNNHNNSVLQMVDSIVVATIHNTEINNTINTAMNNSQYIVVVVVGHYIHIFHVHEA